MDGKRLAGPLLGVAAVIAVIGTITLSMAHRIALSASHRAEHTHAVLQPRKQAIRRPDKHVVLVPPRRPEAAYQFTAHALSTPLHAGAWINTTRIAIAVHMSSPMPTARLQPQVEIRPIDQPLIGRPTATGPFVAYTGHAVQSIVRIAGLHNGVTYHWQARARDGHGRVSAWMGPRGVALHVDLQPPSAPALQLVTPHQPGNWIGTRRLTVRWSVPSDPSGIAGYSYTLTRDPSVAASKAWPLPWNGVTIHAGSDGTWYVSVRPRNKAGSWGPATRLAVHIDTTVPRLQVLGTPSSPINPQRVGTIAHLVLTHRSRVVVEIVDRKGRVVRVIPTHVHPPGYRMDIGWDGLDGKGVRVPNGSYTMHISAFTLSGIAWQTTRRLQIDGVPPVFTSYGLSQTDSYDPYNNSIDGPETVTATLDEPAHVQLDLLRQNGAKNQLIRQWTLDEVQAGQVMTATWEGMASHEQLLPEGTYVFRAVATDEAGNTSTQQLGALYLDNRRIVVSLKQQRLWALDGNRVLLTTLVTTGGPELPTPTGDFQIIDRESPFTFHSPFPKTSPYWYPDSPTNFALLFQIDGYFIHDAPWRTFYGPGSNAVDGIPGSNTTGTHGCVNVPYQPMAWLFNWATMYTPVQIRDDFTPPAS